ncbi:hypothetical protein [Streptomyces humidus]|uniref:hypothetical protein n=1 Tax=Streptomyces humidus TaxID=52259 RepID=UPI00167D91E5|nr:hypothetical protein [Streptomyces humidus]
MRLIDVEIGRYDWASFECGCTKSAVHLAGDLRRLAKAQSEEEARALHIENHALIQSIPQQPAEAVASVLMAALAGELSPGARFVCLDLLGALVFNDGELGGEVPGDRPAGVVAAVPGCVDGCLPWHRRQRLLRPEGDRDG